MKKLDHYFRAWATVAQVEMQTYERWCALRETQAMAPVFADLGFPEQTYVDRVSVAVGAKEFRLFVGFSDKHIADIPLSAEAVLGEEPDAFYREVQASFAPVAA